MAGGVTRLKAAVPLTVTRWQENKSRRKEKRVLWLRQKILTPDETEAQRERQSQKNVKLSRFNEELRRQAEAEVVAQDPDEETKEDGPSESPSEMSITEGEAGMQRWLEQKSASTVRRMAMQSNQDSQSLRE
jgi:hypothetical protein